MPVCVFADVYEKKIVIADFLSIRSKPSVLSKRLNFLPYGTEVYVNSSGIKQRVDGVNDKWYKLKGEESYVFGAYLSEKKAASRKKKMYLKRKNLGCDCKKGCYFETEEYNFYNGKVLYLKTFSAENNDKTRLAYAGKYVVKNHTISILFYKVKELKKGGKTRSMKDNMVLVYKPEINSYLPDTDINDFLAPGTEVNKDMCYFMSKKEKQNRDIYNSIILGKTKKSGKSCIWKRVGYFCMK